MVPAAEVFLAPYSRLWKYLGDTAKRIQSGIRHRILQTKFGYLQIRTNQKELAKWL